MKKKIIFISIIVLAIILIILGLYNIKKYEKYVCIIESIENDSIIAKDFNFMKNNNINIDNNEEVFIKKYEFSVKDAILIDYNRKIIDIFQLEIGDKIEIVNKKPKYKIGLAQKVEPLYDIKIIRLLDN